RRHLETVCTPYITTESRSQNLCAGKAATQLAAPPASLGAVQGAWAVPRLPATRITHHHTRAPATNRVSETGSPAASARSAVPANLRTQLTPMYGATSRMNS